ncbi:hypothetical protein, partial [Paracraurococcus ruber]|uniref:hypothetical protein n=1 Tax=Paracraurococcus ruber TaxID=77675 RepID=UPI00195F7FB5
AVPETGAAAAPRQAALLAALARGLGILLPLGLLPWLPGPALAVAAALALLPAMLLRRRG